MVVASNRELPLPFTCVPAENVLQYDASITHLRKILGFLEEVLTEAPPP